MITAERISLDIADNFVFQRSLLAYLEAADRVDGKVLEIGAGMGYGIEHIASNTDEYMTIDKFPVHIDPYWTHVDFKQMNVPPLKGIESNYYDYVVSFQVIEHIEKDHFFTEEIARVLKPGGKFIVTTPNIKMSLTRNPWHVREYTIDQLNKLLSVYFSSVETLGVYGNDKIKDYYEKNKESVKKITRFDIFDLQHKLPRKLLQIPFDILNRFNRKKLLNQHSQLVTDIQARDYHLAEADDQAYDLFFIATK